MSACTKFIWASGNKTLPTPSTNPVLEMSTHLNFSLICASLQTGECKSVGHINSDCISDVVHSTNTAVFNELYLVQYCKP